MRLLRVHVMIALTIFLLVFVGPSCTDEMIEDIAEELKKELRKDMEEAVEEQKQSVFDKIEQITDDLKRFTNDFFRDIYDSIGRSVPWLPIDDNDSLPEEQIIIQPQLIKFHPPLDGKLWISQTYHNDNFGNRAVDFSADSDSTVYAVGNGVIDSIDRAHPKSCAQFRLVLDKSDIVVWYVHVKANAGYNNGDSVVKGFPLGIICKPNQKYEHYKGGAHLHLGLEWKKGSAGKPFPGNFPNLMDYLPIDKNLYGTRSDKIKNAWFSNGEIDFYKVGTYGDYGYKSLSYLLE